MPVYFLKIVKHLQLQLKLLRKRPEKEKGVRWFPPYGSSGLLNRYQCIKLTYPGLYFATLSAEKQIIPLRPPQSHTATAESSDLASVRPL